MSLSISLKGSPDMKLRQKGLNYIREARRRKCSNYPPEIILCHQSLSSFPTDSLYARWMRTCSLLDLTGNFISSLEFLSGFCCLKTLILDENRLNSMFRCYQLDSLENLSVNKNEISNLPVFLNNVKCFFPQMVWLSMMNNPAAPSYFNGGSKMQHDDYRLYACFRLPHLTFLDCERITEDEVERAQKRYGAKGNTAMGV